MVGVGSATAAREALAGRRRGFDLVLLDLHLGDADGFDLLVELRAAYPALPVVVVSASDRSADVIRAIDLGAMGFVPKRASNETLFEALQHRDVGRHLRAADDDAIAADGRARPSGAGGARVRDDRRGLRRPAQSAAALAALGLTPRQTDVLALLLQGQPNKLIARELNLSVETVKDHVAAVLRALGVNSRTQAVLAVSQMSHGPGWHRTMAASSFGADRSRRRPTARPGRPARRARRSIAYAPMATRLRAAARTGPRAPSPTIPRRWPATWSARRRHRPDSAPAPCRGRCCGLGRPVRGGLAAAAAGWRCAMRRREPSTEKRLLARLRTWQAGVLIAGSAVGRGRLALLPYGSGPQQIALVLVVYTFSVASVPVLAPQFPLFVVFVALVFGPAIAARRGPAHRRQLAARHPDDRGDGDDRSSSAATTAPRSTASSP